MMIRTCFMRGNECAKVKDNIVYVNKNSLSKWDTQFILYFLNTYCELTDTELIKSYKYMNQYNKRVFYNLSDDAEKLIRLCFNIEIERRNLIIGKKALYRVKNI